MHGSSEEFEIQPDPTTDCGVSFPWVSDNGKNGVATFSWLFLIGSISYLQVMMAYMRAWVSLKFGQIRQLVSIATDRVIMEKKRCCHFFSAVFYPILFILAVNDDMHES